MHKRYNRYRLQSQSGPSVLLWFARDQLVIDLQLRGDRTPAKETRLSAKRTSQKTVLTTTAVTNWELLGQSALLRHRRAVPATPKPPSHYAWYSGQVKQFRIFE
jgi:hypothetical protein